MNWKYIFTFGINRVIRKIRIINEPTIPIETPVEYWKYTFLLIVSAIKNIIKPKMKQTNNLVTKSKLELLEYAI